MAEEASYNFCVTLPAGKDEGRVAAVLLEQPSTQHTTNQPEGPATTQKDTEDRARQTCTHEYKYTQTALRHATKNTCTTFAYCLDLDKSKILIPSPPLTQPLLPRRYVDMYVLAVWCACLH